jgi:transmembrane sensor
MTNDEFNRIIDRYQTGQSTIEETRLMETFFESLERKQLDPDQAYTEALWEEIAAAIREPAQQRRPWRNLAIIAASLIVVMLFGYFGYVEYSRNTRELITKSAPFGEKSIVTLSDGSRVFLNSGSSISFPRVFDESQREITLEGEAFFDVKPNPKRPFIVRTGDLVTRVLGTSFDIMAFDTNEISVTVATGRVQVFQDPDKASSQNDRLEPVFLDPEQRVTYQNHAFTISHADVQKSVAWRNNTLDFDETPLSTVGTMLERWYAVDIQYDNQNIVNCRINGQFKGQRLEEVLKSIRYMYNIEYEILTPNKIMLYGEGCKK